MPLLYGEGSKAFHRLQLDLFRSTNDHTLFDWTEDVGQSNSFLAPSPKCFREPYQPLATPGSPEALIYETTNHGLRITLPCKIHSSGLILARLHCRFGDNERIVVELQYNEDEQRYLRTYTQRMWAPITAFGKEIYDEINAWPLKELYIGIEAPDSREASR